MIPPESLSFEKNQGKKHEYHKGYHLLQNLKLNQGKWSSVQVKPYAVCRYLENIFKKGNPPTDENDCKQTHALKSFELPEFQVTIPGKNHKSIG